MRRLSVLGLAVWSLVGCAAPQLRGPSRKPEPGCLWRPFEAKALGVRLHFQDCAAPSAHYELSVNGEWLEQRRPSDEVTFNGPAVLKVFVKPAHQPITEAIAQVAIGPLTGEAKASCQVVPVRFLSERKGRELYEVVPTGAYRARIEDELSRGPRDYGCGDFGKGMGVTYFEYHPEESRTRFAFVIYGMDEHPLFDEESLTFF